MLINLKSIKILFRPTAYAFQYVKASTNYTVSIEFLKLPQQK